MIGVVFVEFHVDNVGIKTLISFKICYSKWNFFYKKFLVHAFPQNFLNYILYIYCDDFKPCLFNFLFSLNSHNTKMLCTICLLMAKVCNYQCRFFFFSLLLDYFFFSFFFWLWMMNMCTWLLTRTVIGHVYTCIDFETLSKVNIKCLSLL